MVFILKTRSRQLFGMSSSIANSREVHFYDSDVINVQFVSQVYIHRRNYNTGRPHNKDEFKKQNIISIFFF